MKPRSDASDLTEQLKKRYFSDFALFFNHKCLLARKFLHNKIQHFLEVSPFVYITLFALHFLVSFHNKT